MAVFEKKVGAPPVFGELVRRINDDAKRLRILEQRSLAIDSRVAALDQTVIEQFRKVEQALQKLSERLETLEDRTSRLEDDARKAAKQLDRAATKNEVQELFGLIDIFNPVKSQFVSKPELERILAERLKPKE